jgi:hypothetical protein
MIDMTWIFFVINKGWHGLSGEWCGHLAWRDRTLVFVINKGWHGLSGKWNGHLTWRDRTPSDVT